MRHRRRNRGARPTNADQAPAQEGMEQSSGEPHVDQNGPDAPSKVLIDGQPVMPSSAPFDIEQSRSPSHSPTLAGTGSRTTTPAGAGTPTRARHPAGIGHPTRAGHRRDTGACGGAMGGRAGDGPTRSPSRSDPPASARAEPRTRAGTSHGAGAGARCSRVRRRAGAVDEPTPPSPSKPSPEPKHVESKEARRRSPSISTETEELLPAERPVTLDLPRVIAIANQKGGVGQDHHHREPGRGPGRASTTGSWSSTSIRRATPPPGLGIDARNFELSMYDVIMRDQPLEDCIEPTSVKNLFVAPATIDLAGVEIELVPAFSRELKLQAGHRRPSSTTSTSS